MSENHHGQATERHQANRRTHRRQRLLMAGIVATAVLFSFVMTNFEVMPVSNGNRDRTGEQVVDIVTAGRALSDADLWRGRAEQDLLALQRDNEHLRAALQELGERLDRLPAAPDPWEEQITREMLEGLSEPEKLIRPEEEAVSSSELQWMEHVPPSPDTLSAAGMRANYGISIVSAEPEASTVKHNVAKPEEPVAETDIQHPGHKRNIPAGSFFPAVILGSLDAPTSHSGSSNPHPVLLRIEDRGWLPNRFRRNVKDCLVTGAGYGDMSSERAYIRTERLSCISSAGMVIDIPVKGYVAGEDGKTGVRGRLVSRQGQMLARSLIAGLASGIGDTFHDHYSEIKSLDSVGEGTASIRTYPEGLGLRAGIAKGTANSLERLAGYYLDLADRMHPVIEISAGRNVDIVLQESIELPELKSDDDGQTDDVASPLETRYGTYAKRR